MHTTKKESKKGYLYYSTNKYVFKVKPRFRGYNCTEAYLRHC